MSPQLSTLLALPIEPRLPYFVLQRRFATDAPAIPTPAMIRQPQPPPAVDKRAAKRPKPHHRATSKQPLNPDRRYFNHHCILYGETMFSKLPEYLCCVLQA